MTSPSILHNAIQHSTRKISIGQDKLFTFHASLTKVNTPVKEGWLVYIYEKATGLLFHRTTTDSLGNFSIQGLERRKGYFVVAFDKDRIYNSVTYELDVKDTIDYSTNPLVFNDSLVKKETYFALTLAKQIVNLPNLMASLSCVKGGRDDTGFNWTSSDWYSTAYTHLQGVNCFRFRNASNWIYFRRNNFNEFREPSTIEFWVRPDSGTSDRAIVSSLVIDSAHQYIGVSKTGNLKFHRPAGIKPNIPALIFETNAVLTTSDFTHVAVVFTGSSVNVYINGVLDTVKQDDFGFSCNVNGIELGRGGFAGYIGGFKLYSTVLYSENFTPSKELILGISTFEDPLDLYASNMLFKLAFPTYSDSSVVRDIAKNAILTTTTATNDFSITTNGLFETVFQNTNYTFRRRQFTFECIFRLLEKTSDITYIVSNTSGTGLTLGLGQWAFSAGTPSNPTKFVFSTYQKEYPLNYSFVLNEVVSISILKDGLNVHFYVNGFFDSTHVIEEALGNASDKLSFSGNTDITLYDVAYYDILKEASSAQNILDRIPDRAFSVLSYSYNLTQDISSLGLGFIKEGAITTSEEYYSPEHSLVLDGKPLVSLEYTGDSLIPYDYTFAILPKEIAEDNIVISLDKDDDQVVVSLTSDFRLKVVTKDAEFLGTDVLSKTQFNLVTVTFNLNEFKVYLDGILQVVFPKVVSSTTGSSIIIGEGISGYLDDLSFYRNRVIHKTNFDKPLPLTPEIFNSVSDIQINASTKYFLDFSKHTSGQNAFPDSKLNANWTIYHSWIYPTGDKWLRFDNHGGVYYSGHNFYHNKSSFFSLSVRIRHIFGNHNANGWTVLFYHNYSFFTYLNRKTGAVMVEFYNSGTYITGVTAGYTEYLLNYDEYDFTITFQNGRFWFHINKELLGSVETPSNWTNTSNHWFGVGTTGGGSYPIGFYDLKYFRYDLNNTEYPEKNLEHLADKLAFKLNCSSEVTSVGKTLPQFLFDNSNNNNTWVNNGDITAKSLIPLSGISSLTLNGLTQYLSSEKIPLLDVSTLPFTFNFQVHLSTLRKHPVLYTAEGSSISILSDGSFEIKTTEGEVYTSEYKLEALRPYRISILRRKDQVSIYVDTYLRDIIIVSPYDTFNFSGTEGTLIGSDLVDYFNGELSQLSFYTGSSLTPKRLPKEAAPFNYLVNATFTPDGVIDTNPNNVWTSTSSVVINDSIKKFQKYSATFSNSYYSSPSSTELTLGISDFTMECTFRLTTMPTSSFASVFGDYSSDLGFCLFIRPRGILDFRLNKQAFGPTGDNCIKIDAWSTVTIVREAGFVTGYYNGTVVFQSASTQSITSVNPIHIGRNNVPNDFFNGQIESFKIIKKAVHPTHETTRRSRPSIVESEFNLTSSDSFDIESHAVLDTFYPEQIYSGLHLEYLNKILIISTKEVDAKKFYLNKIRSLFEGITFTTMLSENPFSILFEENVELIFRSTGITILKDSVETILPFGLELTETVTCVVNRQVTECEIWVNDVLFDARTLFSRNKPDYNLAFTFKASSAVLSKIAFSSFKVNNAYTGTVYLFSPLKNSSTEYIHDSVQEVIPSVFVEDALQVKQQTLQMNTQDILFGEVSSNTLQFRLNLKQLNQTILTTDLYKIRVNLTGLFELLVQDVVVLTSATPLQLNTFVNISVEKYKNIYKLFVNGVDVGTSDVLESSETLFNKVVLGDIGSDFLISNIVFTSGAINYDKILEALTVVNDYNTQPLALERGTSSYLTFDETPHKDSTGRLWSTIGSSVTTVSNVSPVTGKAVYMNGTDDYLMTDAGLISGSATPFVVEFLVRPDALQPINGYYASSTATTGSSALFAQNYNTGSGEQFFQWSRDNGRVGYSIGSVRAGAHLGNLRSVNSVPKEHWTKVALTYDGKTMRILLNGRLEASASYATGWMNNGSRFRLGHCLVEGYADYRMSFAGHFDEFRVTDGTCHMFKDYSRYDKDLISYLSFDDVSGSSTVFDNKGISWIASNISYNTNTVYPSSYSSLYFNGNTKVSTTDRVFNFGTNTFSIKVRFYPTDPSVYTVLFSNNSPDTGNLLSLTIANSSSSTTANSIYFYHKGSNITSSKAVKYNAWNEAILQREGTSLKLLLNGELTEGTIGESFVCDFNFGGSTNIGIPAYTTNSNFKGYLDSIAVYKTAIIPTATTPVLNLPLQYNVFDLDNYDTDWTYNDIKFERVNGRDCCYFNGTSSYLTSSNAKLNLGTEDFIIKFEMCPKSFTNVYGRIIATKRGEESSSKQYMMLTGSSYHQSDKKQSLFFGQQDNDQHIFSQGFTATAMQWYSVEIIRKAGQVTFYVDGVSYNTATINKVVNFMENGAVFIGSVTDGALTDTSQFFHGYLRDFKVYKGISSLL